MPLERAEITVKEGTEDEFFTIMTTRALPILAGVPGVGVVKFGRGVENPGKFIILCEWASMEAHAAFKTSDVYIPFVTHFGAYSTGGIMEHFEVGEPISPA